MPLTLSDHAEQLEAQAEAAYLKGDYQLAAELFRVVVDLFKARIALEVSLTVKQQAAILKGVEHSEKTRSDLSKRFSRKKDPNMDAAREAGIPSLRALAGKLGCSASFLSQVAAGDRPMPADKAEAFKKLTGKAWQ